MTSLLNPPLTLAQLNAASRDEFTRLLDGLCDDSPWVVATLWERRPFASLAQLKHALATLLREAGRGPQIALIRAQPGLVGRPIVGQVARAGSGTEQSGAGPVACTPAESERLQALNTAYGARFGWPCILALRGPRGLGLRCAEIIDSVARRLENHPEFELAECLRNIHRIAEFRLNDRFGAAPVLGQQAWDCAELLANHSDPGHAERGELTVTYLTAAHRACAAQLLAWMVECGFDAVHIDAVGNVVGVYEGSDPAAPRLLTGSHYDTVRNGGKYDGRLGIFVPMICVRELQRAGRRLPFGIELVGFAEEEGQRYKTTFLGSGALTGSFDPAWLAQRDADGISMQAAMAHAGLPATPAAIEGCRRDPAAYQGFVEVHIEQGPVLNALDLPLGVVTSINGSLRYLGDVVGMASHAGTTPMATRRDAATAVAELALYLERRAAAQPELVATMGILVVPNGSTNVVPGRCQFTLDIRATTDMVRDACARDVLAELATICDRRGVSHRIEETMRAAAAPSDPAWQARWERAVAAAGLPLHRMPSGAGHDAMKLDQVMPQAMLFVRGQNAGISHNPLESTTADDMQLAIDAFTHLLTELAETGTPG